MTSDHRVAGSSPAGCKTNKFREHENYGHRPHERQTREVEAEATQHRIQEMEAKIDALFSAKGKAPSHGQNRIDSPSQPSPATPAA